MKREGGGNLLSEDDRNGRLPSPVVSSCSTESFVGFSPTPLPSFQETYTVQRYPRQELQSLGIKMDEDCYNNPVYSSASYPEYPTAVAYHHHHHHHHQGYYQPEPTPTPTPVPQEPQYSPMPMVYSPAATTPVPPPTTAPIDLHTAAAVTPRQGRASLPLQRSESTR